jgi:hypothetical protein
LNPGYWAGFTRLRVQLRVCSVRFLIREPAELFAFCSALSHDPILTPSCPAGERERALPLTAESVSAILYRADALLGASPDTWFVVGSSWERGHELTSRRLESAVDAIEHGEEDDAILVPYNDGGMIVVCSNGLQAVPPSAVSASWWKPRTGC